MPRLRKRLLIVCHLLLLCALPKGKICAAPPVQIPSSLDLDEALQLFRAHGLDLLLADTVVAQAKAGVLQAGALPNPVLSGSFSKAFDYDPNDPATCPPGSGCSDLGFTVGLSDQALWDLVSGKRGLRQKVACAALLSAQLTRKDIERHLVRRLKQQLLRVALSQRLVEFSQEVAATAERATQLSRQRFSTGASSEVELAKIETEGFSALSALERARTELRLDQVELAFLLGARSPVPPFSVRLDLTQHDAARELATDDAARGQAIEQALAHRPDVQAQAAEQARAHAGLSAAYRQRVPDVTLSVAYQQQGRGQTAIQPPSLTVGAQLSLPIYTQAQGSIARSRAELSEQSLLFEKRKAQVVAEVESGYATLMLQRSLLNRLENGLLERAQKARDLSRLRYEKGAASLLEYLDAQRVYIAMHKEYLAALASYFSARFALELALGM